jgi:probable HAF family extracellular repeat protein
MLETLRFVRVRGLRGSQLLGLLAALCLPSQLFAQPPAVHHHYKLIVIETRGLSIYNTPVTTGGGATEFSQVLNNRGSLVGGVNTPLINTGGYPNNCFNVQQPIDCYIQHAFVWQNGQLTDLGTLPGGLGSFAFFISDNGLIAGASENGAIDPVANTPETHAVLWSNGRLNDLGTLGGTQSLGAGVNDAGQVTGFAQNAIPDPFSLTGLGTQTRAFLWQNGVMQDLNTLGGPDAFAQYVNNHGQVAGVSYTSYTPDSNTGLPPLHPFLWQNGTMRDLGNFGGTNPNGPFIFGLNNRGEVTGTMTLPGDQTAHAFLSDGEKLIDLNVGGGLGGTFSQPSTLNDAGEVVGFATLPGDQTQHAFLWKKGVMTDLGTLHGDPCSTADSINSSGQVVGASQSAAGGCNFYTGAFLRENGGPIVDLNTLLSSPSTLLLVAAFWINDQGEITGAGVPAGCGDGDLCGRGYLLIPCDANHPNIEGCDYSLVDGATAAALSQKRIAADPATARQALSPVNTMARLRSLMSKHNRWFGARATTMAPGPQ